MAVRILWKEKERSKIRAVKMDNLKGLLGIRRIKDKRVRSDEGAR